MTPRHTWADDPVGGTPIIAAKLNEIEQDISNALSTGQAAASALPGKVATSTFTAKGDLVVASSPSTPVRLPVGSDNQVLTADAAQTAGVKWASPPAASTTTKGDLAGYSTAPTRVPVGANGQVLTADSSATYGLKWAAAATTTGTGGGANVLDYGAVGNGTTDDTAAFDAARAASRHVIVPPGTYLYTGTGLEADGLFLDGAGPQSSVIKLGAGKSLVSAAGVVESMNVSNLRFTNGFGAIRLGYTGTSVAGSLLVANCEFWYYTGAAISSLSVDQPYWRIHNNAFYANDDTSTTFGVVLVGDNAGSVISANQFLQNRVHIKLGQNSSGTGASAVHVHDNDFIRFTAYGSTARTDLWLVPYSQTRSSGFLCHDNKFGSENLGSGDYRVLYADEVTGGTADATGRLYSTSASVQRISGQIYRGNYQNSLTTARIPFITSYVPWTLAQVVRDHTLDGSVPTYIMNMLATTTTDASFSTSVVGPIASSEVGISGFTGMQACNVSGYVVTLDPTNQLQQIGAPLPQQGGSSLTGFVDLTSSIPVGSYSLAGATSRAAVTDSRGGSDAGTITVPSGSIYATLTGLTVGVPVWVEFDARLGGASQVSSILVSTAVNGADRWKRQVPLTSTWRRWRFLFTPKDAAVNQVTFYPPTTTGSFDLGRVRVYHAAEPVAMDLLVVPANTQTASYTLAVTDAGKAVELNVGTANTLTIPTNATVPFPIGTVIEVCQYGAGQTTVAGAAGVTLRAPDGAKLAKQYASASLRQRAVDEWILAGSVTP